MDRIRNPELNVINTPTSKTKLDHLVVVGNDDFGALAAGEGGVGEGENPATRHQEQEQQMGPEVKRGAAQPALAPHWLHMLSQHSNVFISVLRILFRIHMDPY